MRHKPEFALLAVIVGIMALIYTGAPHGDQEERQSVLAAECLEDRPWAQVPPTPQPSEAETMLCEAWAIGAVYGNNPRYDQ